MDASTQARTALTLGSGENKEREKATNNVGKDDVSIVKGELVFVGQA